MRKLLLVIFVLITFTSCLSQSGMEINHNATGAGARIINFDSNICNNGELYVDDQQRLNFVDFTTMQSAVICAKPNCRHIDRDTCSSFGMGNQAILYGANIYFFDRKIIRGYDNTRFDTTLKRADIDGTGRIDLMTLEDRSLKGLNILLVGDTIYFELSRVFFDEFGSSESYSEEYLCSYNIKCGEYTEISKAVEGYNAGITIIGEFNDCIYFNTSYVEEEIPWEKYADPSFDATSLYINSSYIYDVETGEIVKIEEVPIYALNGVLIISKNGILTLRRKDGSEMDISYLTDFNGVVNNILFSSWDGVAVDIELDKRYELLTDKNDTIIDFVDGKYVIRHSEADGDFIMGMTYTILPTNDVIGDELI